MVIEMRLIINDEIHNDKWTIPSNHRSNSEMKLDVSEPVNSAPVMSSTRTSECLNNRENILGKFHEVEMLNIKMPQSILYKVINSVLRSDDMLNGVAVKNIGVITGLMAYKETNSEIKSGVKKMGTI